MLIRCANLLSHDSGEGMIFLDCLLGIAAQPVKLHTLAGGLPRLFYRLARRLTDLPIPGKLTYLYRSLLILHDL